MSSRYEDPAALASAYPALAFSSTTLAHRSAETIKQRKETVRRSRHIMETVEDKAMPAGILCSALRTKIENLLPPDALAVSRIEKQSVHDYFTRLAEITAAAS